MPGVELLFQVLVHQGPLNEPAHVSKLIAILNKADGSVLKRNPRVLTKGSTAMVELTLDRAICLEAYTDSREFGRVLLRKESETIAAGVISKIITFYQPAALRVESRSSSAWSLGSTDREIGEL
jgi:translation elongation factor EF-1alpha